MRGGLGIRRAPVVVGREVELELLLRAVRDARGGTGECIFLVGEGGVGKTRLLNEAGTTARRLGVGVLSARSAITTPVAFSLIAEALRSWLRGRPADPAETPFDFGLRLVLPEWNATAGAAPELSAAQLRLLALEGIVHIVRDIASVAGGAVVLFDDVHAADPESLEALRYLVAARVDGVVIIGALRSGESALADELVRGLDHDGIAEVVEVGALEGRAVSDLVAALLDADPPEALVADIVARTDGIPLLVEEVLDAHVRAGSIEVGDDGTVWRGGTSAVPRTIRGMVDARLDRLTPSQRDVVVAGAVVGDFSTSLVAAVAASDAAAVNAAVTAGIQVALLEATGGGVGFRHSVIREAVVDATVPHTIELMHRRAAAALDIPANANAQQFEQRAAHLAAVGDADEATRLLVAAADASVAEHALLAGERLARAALDTADAPQGRIDAADAFARSLAAQGRWSEALDVDSATTAQRGQTPERSQRMAISALEGGRPDLANAIIEGALAAGHASPLMQIAAGRAALVAGNGEPALAFAERVLDDPATGDVDTRLQALELQGRAFDFLGRRADAEAAWTEQAEAAAAAGRTQSQLRAVVQLGKVELFAGRAPDRLREAVDLARAAGAFVELAWAEENLAIGLALHGDLDAAQEILDDAIGRCRALRLDQLAYLLVARGAIESYRRDSSEVFFVEAETLMPTTDLRLHTVGIRGDLALREGRYDDAVRWQEESCSIMQTMPGVVPSDSPCWLVWALAGAGRRDEARVALESARAMPDLERWQGRPVVLAAAEAMLAGDENAFDAVVADASIPFDRALMRTLAADITKGGASIRWLRSALDFYEEAGATLCADRARQLLRDAGGPVPRRRRKAEAVPAALAVKGITAREAEVLELLGQGLSNAEIAQRLYLSVRTIESHVSALLQKLDARTRGQLTALSASMPSTS